MRSIWTCMLAVIAAVGLTVAAGAEVPNLINYQGILTDSGGLPVEGPHDLTFTVYDDSTAGAALWIEAHADVDVDEGLFNVILGSVTTIPDTLFDDAGRWIGITVDSDPEMTPRMRITSVPWAMRAGVAEYSLSGGTGDSHSLDADDGTPADVVYVDSEGRVSISGGVAVGSGYASEPSVVLEPVAKPRKAGKFGGQANGAADFASLGATSSEDETTSRIFIPKGQKQGQISDALTYDGFAAPPLNGMIIEGDVGIGTDLSLIHI